MKLPSIALSLLALTATPVVAITLDGTGIPSEGLTLQATQLNETGFGNAVGGGQDSTGGSELNQLFADINDANGTLELGITGNLEGNFNKMWIFFDAIDGGENTLLNDNADGGFGEINALAGLTFPAGVTPDHGIRLEIGGGFYGVRFFDLLTNTAQDVQTGGGPGDLPLSNAGGPKGVDFGWDNSNILGVDGATATDAATATTGFEFEIDLVDAFNGFQGDLEIVSFITSSDGTFASNQFLPSLAASTANPGGLGAFTLTSTVTVSGTPIAGALPGDIDGDGDVDFNELITEGDGVSDFDILLANWLETNATFGSVLARSDGDLNEDGQVSIEDFREWKNNAGDLPAAPGSLIALLNAGAVPEPTSAGLALLAAALVGAPGRRRG